MADDPSDPYSRQQAGAPAGDQQVNKYWPPVGCVDNAFGDRNLICACPLQIAERMPPNRSMGLQNNGRTNAGRSIYAAKICKVSSHVAGRTDVASWRISAALSGASCPSFRCMLFSNPTRQWPPAATAAIITSYSL